MYIQIYGYTFHRHRIASYSIILVTLLWYTIKHNHLHIDYIKFSYNNNKKINLKMFLGKGNVLHLFSTWQILCCTLSLYLSQRMMSLFGKQNLTDNNFACHANFTYWWVVLVINWGHLAHVLPLFTDHIDFKWADKQTEVSHHFRLQFIHWWMFTLLSSSAFIQQQTTWKVSE